LQPPRLGEALDGILRAAPADPIACRAVAPESSARQLDRDWIAALAAAIGAAEVAVLVLRPHHGTIAARRVDALEHFEAADIAAARSYGRGQLALGAAAAAAEATLLVWLVARDRGGEQEADSLAVVGTRGAALSLALLLAPLPLRALMRVRALRVGLSTQSWGGWWGDNARSGALGGAFAATAAVIVAALMARYGEDWWKAAAAGSVGVAVVVTVAAPLVLDPIFNDFTPLGEGELRREVLALAERAGVSVGEVFEVDASRRTSAANAYVNGLGASRRVVLYDTLLSSFTPAEARSVVAHELAHVRYRDVPRLLVYLAAVAPAGTRAVAALAQRLDDSAAPGLPALALAGAVVSAALGVVTRQLSRAIERRADAFALELTGDADAFVSFEQRITRQNLADPDPPRWLSALLGTHPPIVERIGIAAAYRAGERPTPRSGPARPSRRERPTPRSGPARPSRRSLRTPADS
jgi:STE24 endopeptidase